jgi:AcrR family transcriptional regulator
VARSPQTLNARSRRTRVQLLEAARALLEDEGFDALTMTALADRAGVTRRAVYLHFPSRADVVDALFDFVADAEGLHDSLQRVWDAPDPIAALTEWARHLSDYHLRLLPFDRAVARVAHADPDALAHRNRVRSEKLANCRRLAQRLADDGRLAAGWTVRTAAEAIDALSTSDVVETLMVDHAWSPARFTRHVARVLQGAFTDES